MSSRTPTLGSLLRAALAEAIRNLHVSLPAKVESYDEAKRSASVKPLIQFAFTGEGGERRIEQLPVITDVPVVFPGSGGVRISWPVSRGDLVLLVFCEASIAVWKTEGGEVDPQDPRRNSLSDAVAIPGILDFKSVSNATPMIEFTSSEVRAGGSSPLATKADIDAIIQWLAAHTHLGVTTGAGVSGIPATLPVPPATGTLVLKGA